MGAFYTREDTCAAKGVAVVLMLAHHLFCFEGRLPGGALQQLIDLPDTSLPLLVGLFGKICVSMFFFLSGLGITLSVRSRGLDLIGRLKGLYVKYWGYVLPFILIGFLFFANQTDYCEEASICHLFASFDLRAFLKALLGLEATYNGEWWFFKYYVMAVATYPVASFLFLRRDAWRSVAAVVIGSLLVSNVLPALGELKELGSLSNNVLYANLVCQSAPWVASFWMGMVCARFDLLERIHGALDANGLAGMGGSAAIVAALVFLRVYCFGADFDLIYVPLLLVSLRTLLRASGIVGRAFVEVGRRSMGIWLVHSFFCYYFQLPAEALAAVGWCLPALCILLGASYASTVALDWAWERVGGLVGRAAARVGAVREGGSTAG